MPPRRSRRLWPRHHSNQHRPSRRRRARLTTPLVLTQTRTQSRALPPHQLLKPPPVKTSLSMLALKISSSSTKPPASLLRKTPQILLPTMPPLPRPIRSLSRLKETSQPIASRPAIYSSRPRVISSYRHSLLVSRMPLKPRAKPLS